jgi:hypothetical protein
MGEENNIDEETYSLIFTSLKHPIRRRILRMLADKPLNYTEILEVLKIDSGHLSYHLENLGDLIVSNDGHYSLSSFGEAAVKFMGGVEDHHPASSNRKFKPRQLLVNVVGVVLALALIVASFHLVTYGVVTSTDTVSTENLLYPLYTNFPLDLQPGETWNLNVTIEHRDPPHDQGFGANIDFQKCIFHIPPLERTLTGWDEAQICVDSFYNMTTLMAYYPPGNVSLTVWNSSTQSFETITVLSNGTPWLSVNPSDATDPYNIELEINTPEETKLTQTFEWTRPHSFEHSSSPPVAVTQAGTYDFTFTNVGSLNWNSFLKVILQFQHFEKPYFYWGVAGFIIACGYIILVAATSYRTRTKK